ncbi:MAG: hypothetical protein EOO92_14725 [Pedobacter sp.]|nr:MAG: hypothetical protein EOO92_14725 [Pedobacter sp.]
MKKLLIIVMACYGLNARAQVDESQDFIYTYSDSLTKAGRITVRPGVAGDWQLRADSRRVPIGSVKFFNNKDGFFANTRKQNLLGVSEFAERVIDGKINLYREVDFDPAVFESGYWRKPTAQPAINGSLFYNKGFEDLKRVNYRNLKEDMADNQVSLDLLAGYRRNMNTTKVLYISAGAAVLAGMASFLAMGYDIDDNAKVTTSFALLGAGFGFAVGGLVVHLSASRNIERAVDHYNR